MMKRKTLLSVLTILIVLIAIYTYANSRQDQHQDEEHHAHQVSRPMELHSVMRLLMLDLHTINEGIFTQNFDLIASGAASIVDHPLLADKTLELLEETLGNQLSTFEEFDHRAHMYADSIRHAAVESHMNLILDHYMLMEQYYITFHPIYKH